MPSKQDSRFKLGNKSTSLTGMALLTAIGLNALSPLPVRAAGPIVVNTNSAAEADDGFCSLTEAVKNANTDSQLYNSSGECAAGSGADQISFDPTLFSTPQTITLPGSQITITDDLTISGPGEDLLTIDGNNASRIFYIDDTNENERKSIHFNHLTLTNGYINNENGGAIFNRENMSLDEITISNSSAYKGGGIYSNTVQEFLKISNSILTGNNAIRDGGGLYCISDKTAIDLIDVNINNNTSSYSDGGFSIHGNISNINIEDTIISNNEAKRLGGGGTISTLNDSYLSIKDSTIINNKIINDSINATTDSGGGLLISSRHGTNKILNTSITGNSIITEENNFAEGGGISIEIGYSDFLIKDTLIDGNSTNNTEGNNSTGGGIVIGGMYNDQNTCILDNVQIKNNISGGSGGGVRLGLYYGGLDLSIINSTIANNISGTRGGGIYAWLKNAEFTVLSSTISGNIAGTNGGGLSVNTSSYYGNTKIINSTISENFAHSIAGGVYSMVHLDITNSTIVSNSASQEGGGIGVKSGSGLLLNNSILAKNIDQGSNPDLFNLNPDWPFLETNILYNLIGDNSGSGLTEAPIGSPDANGNLIGGPVNGVIDPKLGSLANNSHPYGDGSRTQTYALLPDSPALDAVPLDQCVLEVDQRGVPRPQGDACDMGAYELAPAPFFVFMPLTLR